MLHVNVLKKSFLQANNQQNDNDKTHNEAWKKNKASCKQTSNKITMMKYRMKFKRTTKFPTNK
jgi:hypothetical protein